jgi:hypothetical protein
MNEDNCARLEKIQGGVDLINEKLSSSNQLANERHETMRAKSRTQDADEARRACGRAGNRKQREERRAQRARLIGRILWTIIGAVPVGIGAALLRLLGA